MGPMRYGRQALTLGKRTRAATKRKKGQIATDFVRQSALVGVLTNGGNARFEERVVSRAELHGP
jgi:hypothetical protein